ncbi:MAG: hypothetical protein JO125_02010 [Chloroflexi bacterium]|nr:hypothetical protein [Ktedonobacteraceae bacterium]MBV9706167.1 hypothetical protein [Chloroflexota bacterium]
MQQMHFDPALIAQIAPYQPWLLIGTVLLLFMLLRFTRKALRKRVDEVGFRLMREKGLLIWFWLNAPGVIIHEMSHALVVLLFYPFHFRITSITFFRIKPLVQRSSGGRVVRAGGRQSLQLGEVQYVRPQGSFISYVGDGFSGIAPLFGGVVMFTVLYWIATGYNLWDMPIDIHQHLQLLRPGWPWWTLIFTPYLILTVTSELWPSRQDWYGARWLTATLALVVLLALIILWYFKHLDALLQFSALIASRLDFALLILVLLDVIFLIVAELCVRAARH